MSLSSESIPVKTPYRMQALIPYQLCVYKISQIFLLPLPFLLLFFELVNSFVLFITITVIIIILFGGFSEGRISRLDSFKDC